ncbi:MAG: ATP-grasp domain-containing protein [Bacilli bacterium]|nr:ATP-grasp domain-containing protein [Bacilli bacterium]
MNFVFISPNFPTIYSHFVKSLTERGVRVLGIGDAPYNELNDELKTHLCEYCRVTNLANIEWMKNTLDYLEGKYGQLDYVESNNEFWLMNDSVLREYKRVPNGFYPSEMEKIKYKSKMKEYFIKAGVKVARYTLVNSLEECEKFIESVGYPTFAKPDNGVGAGGTYKINNKDDLIHFFNSKSNVPYIMEEYINGEITTFDGVCDDESNVVLSFNEIFPIPVAEVVNQDVDDYYYANMEMSDNLRKLGEAVIKSFGVRKRCFHIEFFRLKEDKPGLGKKDDILGLEVNMRSPGGNTPDLLSIALNDSYYDVYADTIVYNETNVDLNKEHFISISVSRKNRFSYVHSLDEIYSSFKDNIIQHGYYDKAIADAMGDEFFFGRFKQVDDALNFQKFVMEKK